MIDAARFADLLTGYCLEVEKGQQVVIRSTPLATPLLLELQRAMLQRGAWPLMRLDLPGQAEGFHAHAQDWQLDDFPELAMVEARRANATLSIQAPENTRALTGIDPERLARVARAQIGRAHV